MRDKSTPRLKSKDKVEQSGNVLANVFDDGADSVDPTRPNVCNSFLNKGACLQPGCKYLHFRPDAAYPSYGYRKGHSNKSYGHSLANVSGSGPSRPSARKSNKTCFQYSKTGHCKFGFRYRFQHVRENSHSQWPIENEHNHVKTGYNYPLPEVNFYFFFRGNEKRDCTNSKGYTRSSRSSASKFTPECKSHSKQHSTVHVSSCKPRATFFACAGGNRCGATVDKKFVRPKRVRRGRKPKKDSRGNQSRLCKFLYADVRGFRSKSESINQIIEEHDVDVVLLTETKIYTNSAIDIKGFRPFSAVRDKKSGGGLYLGVWHGLYESVMIDSGSKASFVTVCLNGKYCSVRLILVCGPQENDFEDKDSFYNGISVQVEMSYLNGDSVIMVGDFNAKLGYNVIPKDLHPMSKMVNNC